MVIVSPAFRQFARQFSAKIGGRGVTATHLASNQRSRGRHPASAPFHGPLVQRHSIPGLHPGDDGSVPSWSAISMRHHRRGGGPLKPAEIGSTPIAAAIPMPPARKRLSYGCQGGSAPPFGTMLTTPDGNGHASCDLVGFCSNQNVSTNYRWAQGAMRTPNP